MLRPTAWRLLLGVTLTLPLAAAGCAARTAVTDVVVPPAFLEPEAKVTVLEFFSAHCPCQAQHDARLRELHARYAPRGAAFRAISSEESIDRPGEAAEAARRRYPFPLLHDEGSQLARALGADYATYTVVVDARGRILYRGGIDSDKRDLHDDARTYLADALDDALAGRPVRVPEARTLGCALQVH